MSRSLVLAAIVLALASSERGCATETVVGLDLAATHGPAELRSDSLDLAFLASDPGFARRGFTPLEGGSTWTQSARARLRLPFRSTGAKLLRMRVRAHESLGPALLLGLSLNGRPLEPVLLGTREQEFQLVLPSALQVAGDNTLLLSAPRQRSVGEADADRRPLVAAFSQLSVQRLGAEGLGEGPLERGRGVSLPPSASAAYYLRVPASAVLAVVTGRERAPARLTATIKEDGGVPTPVPPLRPAAAAGAAEQFDLARWSGRIVRLELANDGERGTLELQSSRLLCPAPPAAARERSGATARPSILLYVVDTLRADMLGAYGSPRGASPRFDAFAREALLFDDTWAQASWTRAAMASVFSGQHVAVHGLDREDTRLHPEQVTLAERLREAGYRTGAFVANHLMGGRVGLDRGFQTWNEGDDGLYGRDASVLGERALRWIDAKSGPFFLYVHTLEPHSPYSPGPEDSAPFDVPYRGNRDTRALLRLGQLGQLAPEGLRFLESQYLGEVRKNDRAFGELLDGLRKAGRIEDTLVVFTADHGEELLDHGGTEHAKTLYQELIRVPLAVRLPGAARPGARLAGTVEQVDLLPTLLGLAGVPPPPSLPGRDLSRWWQGRAAPQAPPLVFSEERFAVVDKFAARAGSLKLIFNNDGPALWRKGAHVELYDLAADPAEQVNLAEARPIAGRYLLQELERFRRRAPGSRAETRLVLSAQERDALKALGYVR